MEKPINPKLGNCITNMICTRPELFKVEIGSDKKDGTGCATMTLHPQIIEKKGKKEFVVLPYNEFLLIQEALDDLNDLSDLRSEKEISKNEPTKKLDDIIKNLKI